MTIVFLSTWFSWPFLRTTVLLNLPIMISEEPPPPLPVENLLVVSRASIPEFPGPLAAKSGSSSSPIEFCYFILALSSLCNKN